MPLVFLITLFSFDAAAQAFVGLGGALDFYPREVIGQFSLSGTAGVYLKDKRKFHCGVALITQRHKYSGRIKAYFNPYLYKTYIKSGEQVGITPVIFVGPTIDRHLSVGLMAGYETFAWERHTDASAWPYNVVSTREYRFEHGRITTNLYANVRVFANTAFTPFVHARYGLWFDRNTTVQEVSLSVCVLYRWPSRIARYE